MSDKLKNFIINEKKLKLFLLPKDIADSKNAIIEIRAGTGGLEAAYLLQIYLKCMKKLVKNCGILRLFRFLKVMWWVKRSYGFS